MGHGLWTFFCGLSHFHGHGFWLMCEVALNLWSYLETPTWLPMNGEKWPLVTDRPVRY